MTHRPSPTPQEMRAVLGVAEATSPTAVSLESAKTDLRRNDTPWDGSWEATRQRKFVMALRATPAQRLLWLEQMIQLAHLSGALPRPRKR